MVTAVTNPALRPGGLLEEDAESMRTNIANEFEFSLGDVEQGFRDADIIVEKETTTEAVHQGYSRPQAGVADFQAESKGQI